MLIRLVTLLVLSFIPCVAHAQTQWDVAGTTGLFAGATPKTDPSRGYQELWFETIQGGVAIGRYLTPHLKVEVEGTATGGGTQFRERTVTVPGYPFPYPLGSEVTTSVRSVGSALTWQFRQNEWVHPFLQAGVTADFDRITVRTWEQFLYGDIRGVPPQRIVEERIEGPDTRLRLRGVLGGGAKVYVSEKAFIRTDGRLSLARDRQHIVLRIGFGIDF